MSICPTWIEFLSLSGKKHKKNFTMYLGQTFQCIQANTMHLNADKMLYVGYEYENMQILYGNPVYLKLSLIMFSNLKGLFSGPLYIY